MSRLSRPHTPVRTCLVCGAKKAKASLLRIALDTQERKIVPDRLQRMKGRGAYVCPQCLQRLRFDKRAQKAFRGKARGLAEGIRQPSAGGQSTQPLG